MAEWKRSQPKVTVNQFTRVVRRRVNLIAREGIFLILAILVMSPFETVLAVMIGDTFFDTLPVRYVPQTVVMAMFVRFLVKVWRAYP